MFTPQVNKERRFPDSEYPSYIPVQWDRGWGLWQPEFGAEKVVFLSSLKNIGDDLSSGSCLRKCLPHIDVDLAFPDKSKYLALCLGEI